jgi:hypothetical protein
MGWRKRRSRDEACQLLSHISRTRSRIPPTTGLSRSYGDKFDRSKLAKLILISQADRDRGFNENFSVQ